MWPHVENRLRQRFWMDRPGSGGQWEPFFIQLYRVSMEYSILKYVYIYITLIPFN